MVGILDFIRSNWQAFAIMAGFSLQYIFTGDVWEMKPPSKDFFTFIIGSIMFAFLLTGHIILFGITLIILVLVHFNIIGGMLFG